jgi:hypothetical protein
VVWAEDGLFLEDRLDAGPVVSLVDPYQGYLHVLSRAVVEVAVVLPLRDYAVAVTGLCCLVVGAVAGLVYACSRDVLRTRPARFALALVTVLVPTAPAEILGNSANLHWFLLWLAPWVLLCRPTTRRQGWALGAVLLVVGLSEIQAVYFLPLLAHGARDRLRLPMAAGMLLGLAAQAATTLLVGRQASELDSGTPSVADLVQGYGLHVFLQIWFSDTDGVGSVLVEGGWPLVVLAATPFVAALVALVVGSRGREDVALAGTVVVGAVLPFVAGLVLNFRPFLEFSAFDLETLAVFAPLRYALVPSMFVLAVVVVLADRLLCRPVRWRKAVAGLLLVGLGGIGVLNLDPGPTVRSGYPGWAGAVAAAERECRRGAGRVVIEHAPDSWEVELPCTVVTDDADRR